MVLEEETSTTGNRYKYDADGNPAINKVEVYDSSANSVGSAESKLLFAYLKSDEEKKSVFVFNKGNLTFAGGKYNIPNEYVVPETDAFNIRTLTAMEIMLLQHLTQIMDVEYVEVELEDRSDDHGLYQTAIFKIHKVGEEDKTTLDTYVLKTLATDEDLTHIPEDTNSDELTGIARDVENNNCLYMFYKI